MHGEAPAVRDSHLSAGTIWTVGHSNRPAAEFLDLMHAHAIDVVCDVRRFPGSRAHPHFGQAELTGLLEARGIGYHWIAELGGRRRSEGIDATSAWRHPAFRAYAEHVRSEEFADGLTALLLLGAGARTAVMCSEAVWWRCHRRLIADVLVSLGHPVAHIVSASRAAPHVIQPPARIVRGVLTYEGVPAATI